MIKCPCGNPMQVKNKDRGICAKCFDKTKREKMRQRRHTITYMFEQLMYLKFIRPKQMEVIKLIGEDLSFVDIAKKMNISKQAVDSLLNTALNNTQEILETIKNILHQQTSK